VEPFRFALPGAARIRKKKAPARLIESGGFFFVSVSHSLSGGMTYIPSWN
jgi:hypothetical protein